MNPVLNMITASVGFGCLIIALARRCLLRQQPGQVFAVKNGMIVSVLFGKRRSHAGEMSEAKTGSQQRMSGRFIAGLRENEALAG